MQILDVNIYMCRMYIYSLTDNADSGCKCIYSLTDNADSGCKCIYSLTDNAWM